MAHILVVEHEPMIAEWLAVLIEASGHRVTVTGMLEEALRPAAEAQIAPAVPDIHIMGGETIPVARALAARGVPFVVMSRDAFDAAGYGDAPVLQKPFLMARLEALVNKVLPA